MNSKISVIIPVYNTSRCLKKCLNSVLSQDYKNLEVILVNDSSTDDSLKICKKYADLDQRIKIIDKKKNEGLELARKSGLNLASGDYIMHIDSDDWLDNPRVISTMYGKAEETGADYVEIKAYRTIDKFGLIKKKIVNKRIFGLIEQPDLFEDYFISFFGRSFLSVNIWGKLYRKSFLDRIKIIPMGVKMGEDLAYNIQLFPYLQKIYIIPEFGYHYRFGGMTSFFNERLLTDLKKLHKYKMELVDKYNYEKGRESQLWEMKNILKSDIQQRIRYKQSKEEIIRFLKRELTDPVYEELNLIDMTSKFWDDPFVIALAKKDYEGMYLASRKEEKKLSCKLKLVSFISNLLSKV